MAHWKNSLCKRSEEFNLKTFCRRGVQLLSDVGIWKRLVVCGLLKKHLTKRLVRTWFMVRKCLRADALRPIKWPRVCKRQVKERCGSRTIAKGTQTFFHKVWWYWTIDCGIHAQQYISGFRATRVQTKHSVYVAGVLEKGLLAYVCCISNDDFVFQQGRAPAHHSRHTA